jgi:hypothetical protein
MMYTIVTLPYKYRTKMATMKLHYRSKRDFAPITLRLLFRRDSQDYVLESKTRISMTLNEWLAISKSRRIKDAKLKGLKREHDRDVMDLERHVLTAFNNADIYSVDKTWLNQQLESFYGNSQGNIIPEAIIDYFPIYLESRKHHITRSSLDRYRTAYNYTKTFIHESDAFSSSPKISDIDPNFHRAFEDFGLENDYSINTISKYFSVVQTMCKYAHAYHELSVNPRLNLIKLRSVQPPIIFLNLEELKVINALDKRILGDRLSNVRDWLIISCLTGQRISDFMNFSVNNIREQDGEKIMDILQKKGQKNVSIPLQEQVLEVMRKNDGNFPRQISDQNFNKYVKELAKHAGIDEEIDGGAIRVIESGKKRKVSGIYPKYELITSHIGRRSFASNFYGKISTPLLMNITGHAKESTFLSYIGKSSKDTALDSAREFKKLKIEI